LKFTKEEAQFMIDWYHALEEVGTSFLPLNSEIQKEFEKANEIRLQLWLKVFDEKSEWIVNTNYKKKSKRLGLGTRLN